MIFHAIRLLMPLPFSRSANDIQHSYGHAAAISLAATGYAADFSLYFRRRFRYFSSRCRRQPATATPLLLGRHGHATPH
jgi:hypothetical protein